MFLKRIIKRIKIIFISIFDLYSNLYWSQEGEDIILSRIFSKKTKGFYVDVGAHHSSRFSNTYKLYKENLWRGINIDANFESYSNLQKNRSRDINIHIGISNTKKSLRFYTFTDGALNTFNKKKMLDVKKKYKLIDNKIIICKKLSEILDNFIKKSQKIDLLNIDAEGNDLQVLKSNNWNKYLPKIIIVEISSLSVKKILQHPITRFLNKKKYELYSKLHKSVIFKLK